ncbi:MAG: heme o synthase [Haloferacaceae archaeon]
MESRSASTRLPGLLAATAMGVYLLVLVGATVALTDATSACSSFPACGDGWALPDTADGWVALGHRVVAVVVGLLGAATAVTAISDRPSRRVLSALALAGVLYPAQAMLGAIVASVGGDGTLSAIHLGLGVTIFAALVLALAWTLELRTGDPDEEPTGMPERDLPPEGERTPTIPDDPLTRAVATGKAYLALTKPRLMWLLCLVAVAGMALAAGTTLSARTVALTLGGGVLSIGASGTFNHVLERDIDRRMERTSDRPLPSDLIPVRNALTFGLALALGSLVLFAAVNWLVALLGLIAIAFYSVVYTLILKPNTVQNTVLGGAAGALPALIGWAAVTGEVGLGGLALATLIFLWTPAHFYNLAMAYKDDYERGGFPMLPVVRGETETRKHVLLYLGATFVVAAALATIPGLGVAYLLAAVGVGALFLWAVVRLHYEQTERAAMRAFHASNAYLGAVLLAVVIDTLVI